jgi:hypothetical protein
MLSDAIYFSLVLTPLSPHAVSMQSTDAVHLRKLLTIEKGTELECQTAQELPINELRDCRVVGNTSLQAMVALFKKISQGAHDGSWSISESKALSCHCMREL